MTIKKLGQENWEDQWMTHNGGTEKLLEIRCSVDVEK